MIIARFWSGFGGKISYNYADSDFEYEDQYGGDGVGVSINQDTGEVTPSELLGILPPANLFGLSENVSSVQSTGVMIYGMRRRFIIDAQATSSNSRVMPLVEFATPTRAHD